MASCGDSDSSTGTPEGTIGSVTDSRDGKTYKTIVIGKQTWMAENLNYDAKNSMCYSERSDNCTKFGCLYTWAAAKTACLSDWHLPTKAEFETLFTTVGGQSTVGIMLKSTSGWNNDCNGTDAYSFSALPAGFREIFGMGYDSEGYRADYWSSTDDNNGWSGYAYNMGLYDSRDGAFLDLNLKNSGYSVRCVKDL